MAKENLYFVHDRIADCPVLFFSCQSDGLACRRALLSLRVPLRDCDLYRIGTVDGKVVKTSKSVLVDWSQYRFPETLAEAYAPLKLTPEEMNEVISAREKENSDA